VSVLVANQPTKRATLRRSWSGCWEVSASLPGPAPTGVVVVDWDGWQLLGGEVDPRRSGTFAGGGEVVIVGGLRWRTSLAPKFYRDDTPRGLRAVDVAQDAAQAAGLALEVDAAADRALGPVWPRRYETAASVLSRALALPWRVDLDGITRAGERPAAKLGTDVQVLDYDPRDGVATLYADRPDSVPVGVTLSSPRIVGTRRVTEVAAAADAKGLRMWARTEAA
jgi:hypothetical protein